MEYLLVGRHSEDEGRFRRESQKHGEVFSVQKAVEEEEQTEAGALQAAAMGRWIKENVFDRYGLPGFEGYFCSTAIRCVQTADSLGLVDADWQYQEALNEQDLGVLKGRFHELRAKFPEFYSHLDTDRVAARPPGGESILDMSSGRIQGFLSDIEPLESAILMTHRNWIWGAMGPLFGLSREELAAVDTDEIDYCQIIELTSINPGSGERLPYLAWTRSTNPWKGIESQWTEIGAGEPMGRSAV